MSIKRKIAHLFNKFATFAQDFILAVETDAQAASLQQFPEAMIGSYPDSFTIAESAPAMAYVPSDRARLPHYEARLVIKDNLAAPRDEPSRPNYQLYVRLDRRKDENSEKPDETHLFWIKESSDRAALERHFVQWEDNERNCALSTLRRNVPPAAPEAWHMNGRNIRASAPVDAFRMDI